MEAAARREAERAARHSYGRLVAYLAARSHDIAAAEDALADAFATALEQWPRQGVPNKPEAWLLTVARHRLSDAWRHQQVAALSTSALIAIADEAYVQAEDCAIPDERLKLFFICAHPAIAAAARTPLMLQTVLGLDVARMAGAFLTAPATLAQRLVRAKAKIRKAGIPFDAPRVADLPLRLQDVMDGIYAAYGTGWEDVDGADAVRRGLTGEAIELADTLIRLMPDQAEPRGLLALMLFCEARVTARRDPAGNYVPLGSQDTQRWHRPSIAAAEANLLAAASLGSIGPYQLEAAIQSAHTQRRLGAAVASEHIVALYDGLVAQRPRLGARVSRACAIGEAFGAQRGLAALDAIETELVKAYQPYWAARAHLEDAAEHHDAARRAFRLALGLCQSEPTRRYLNARFAHLDATTGPGS